MLISTHVDKAEEKAELRIIETLENHQINEVLVWRKILAEITDIRSESGR